MSEHKIEREAVLWAWKTLYDVEGIKNHLDTLLELETNLERTTKELVSLRTVGAYYRIADYNQRRCANAGTAESYRKAAEAMDKALGASPGPRGSKDASSP